MEYRDDQASLEARRDDLRRELAEVGRKADMLQALRRDRAVAERELAAVEARLAHQTARRLPLLDRVRIAAPCSASWEAMTGDDRVRFCAGCEKNVYNLSAMARDEAERLLAEREGSICVRLYKRADGTVMTSDCPVGVKRKRRRRTALAVAGAGVMAAGGLMAWREQALEQRRSMMMGAVAPMTPDSQHVIPPATAQPAPVGERVVAPAR